MNGVKQSKQNIATDNNGYLLKYTNLFSMNISFSIWLKETCFVYMFAFTSFEKIF